MNRCLVCLNVIVCINPFIKMDIELYMYGGNGQEGFITNPFHTYH